MRSVLVLVTIALVGGNTVAFGHQQALPTDKEVVNQERSEPGQGSAPITMSGRVWSAVGFLHPAIIHFPIALLLVGGLFVVLGWKWPTIGTQIPLACLLIGALGAVTAAITGWSLAPQQGYGLDWSVFDWDREINVHRMSGSIVAVVSSTFAIIALAALWRDSDRLRIVWKMGLLACGVMVGLVGHQGGELKYGVDFYPRAIRILTAEAPAIPPPAAPNDSR